MPCARRHAATEMVQRRPIVRTTAYLPRRPLAVVKRLCISLAALNDCTAAAAFRSLAASVSECMRQIYTCSQRLHARQ